MKSQIAVYKSHEKAVNAIETLNKSNFPMKQVSLMGKAEIIENHIHIKSLETEKELPVLLGTGAGITVGLLSGLGVFIIPGFGFLYGAGAIIGIIGGFDIGLITGGLGSILVTLGIKEDYVVKCNKHLDEGKYLVVVNGSSSEIERAKHILHTDGNHLELMN